MIERGYDTIVIESKDKTVTKESLVCVTNYNSKTKKWLIGLNYITSMEHALKQAKEEKKKVAGKGDNINKYLKEVFE